eukprot:707405-Prymnesium_polylepis.1
MAHPTPQTWQVVADDVPLKRMRQQLEAQLAASAKVEAAALVQAHGEELAVAKVPDCLIA